MNKGDRNRKEKQKFKKRLNNYGINFDDLDDGFMESKRGKRKINYNCLRTTGKPCSCVMCSPNEEKPQHKVKHKKRNWDDDEY